MKVLIHGAGGHMGRIVCQMVRDGVCGAAVAACVSPELTADPAQQIFQDLAHCDVAADCIVDFSVAGATQALCDYACEKKMPLVIATTGQSQQQRAYIAQAAEKIPVFFAANMSVGVALLIRLARQTVQTFPDAEIEIVEAHHDRKVDAPSGTALAIAHALQDVRPELTLHTGRSGMGKRQKNEIGIHALRYGNVVGEHEVIVSTGTQTIKLRHEAHDRALFAEGALYAASYLMGKPAGLYTMQDMLEEH
jgi:4-hydroxy-tetrahydrodipicolinate reductase